MVEDLQPGSAITTLRGEAKDAAKIEKIVHDYDSIGKALELREPLHYGQPVKHGRSGQSLGTVGGIRAL